MKVSLHVHKYSCVETQPHLLFTYCLWLLSRYTGRVEWLQQKLNKPKIVYDL